MEYLVDVFDLADGARRHCNADAANSDKVGVKLNSAINATLDRSIGGLGTSRAQRYFAPEFDWLCSLSVRSHKEQSAKVAVRGAR
jgi:hypothetical protein